MPTPSVRDLKALNKAVDRLRCNCWDLVEEPLGATKPTLELLKENRAQSRDLAILLNRIYGFNICITGKASSGKSSISNALKNNRSTK